jgi:hypothetical protein
MAREKPALSEDIINIIDIIKNMKLRKFLHSFVCCIKDVVNKIKIKIIEASENEN